MPKLTYTGDDSYHGTDPGNDNQRIDLQPGDSADVSDAKLKQLLADFPDTFKRVRAASKDKKPADYKDLEGDALRKLATDRKVGFDAAANDDTIRAALVEADKTAVEG